MRKLPKILNPCPIVEAIIEVRFSTELPGDAVFGVLYTAISKQFKSNLTKLPMLQIPEALRVNDPDFRYQPHYVLSKENLSIRIGPNVILFSNIQPYVGWDTFFEFVSNTLSLIFKTDVVNFAERVGIRYINIFDDAALLGRINTELTIIGNRVVTETTNIRVDQVDGSYTQVLQIANNVDIVSPTIKGKGSIIDIDCGYLFSQGSKDFFSSYADIIQDGHEKEKNTFFSLLKDDFLQEFNPSY